MRTLVSIANASESTDYRYFSLTVKGKSEQDIREYFDFLREYINDYQGYNFICSDCPNDSFDVSKEWEIKEYGDTFSCDFPEFMNHKEFKSEVSFMLKEAKIAYKERHCSKIENGLSIVKDRSGSIIKVSIPNNDQFYVNHFFETERQTLSFACLKFKGKTFKNGKHMFVFDYVNAEHYHGILKFMGNIHKLSK